jgi:hypothetical protein
LFFLSSVGIHIDYSYCGDDVSFLILDHCVEQEPDCCVEMKDSDCCETEDIVQKQQILDYTLSSKIDFNHQFVILLNFIPNRFNAIQRHHNQFLRCKPPDLNDCPSLPFLQRFLC